MHRPNEVLKALRAAMHRTIKSDLETMVVILMIHTILRNIESKEVQSDQSGKSIDVKTRR